MAARISGEGGDTRDKVRQAALELFIEQGFERTSLREIADRLGFSKAALYYHYPSKAELVESIVRPAVQSLVDFLEGGATDEPCTIREFLGRYFDVIWANRVIWLALTRDPSPLSDLELDSWIQHLYRVSAERIVGADAPPEAQVRVHMAIGGFSRIAMMPSPFPAEVVREAGIDAALGAIGVEGDTLTRR